MAAKLTASALPIQLGELEFRRQLCVQLLIILQQVQNLHVKDKSRHPKDLHFPAVFSVETEDVSHLSYAKCSHLTTFSTYSTNGYGDKQR